MRYLWLISSLFLDLYDIPSHSSDISMIFHPILLRYPWIAISLIYLWFIISLFLDLYDIPSHSSEISMICHPILLRYLWIAISLIYLWFITLLMRNLWTTIQDGPSFHSYEISMIHHLILLRHVWIAIYLSMTYPLTILKYLWHVRKLKNFIFWVLKSQGIHERASSLLATLSCPKPISTK